MRYVIFVSVVFVVVTFALFDDLLAEDEAGRVAIYKTDQAVRGEKIYYATCAGCHGHDLSGDLGPALKGDEFWSSWNGKTARELYSRMITTMPDGNPGSLSVKEALDLMAHILRENGYPAGDTALESPKQLDTLKLEQKK